MRTELPLCRRCCFCIPLRYGLITWGYLRLVLSILLFTVLSIAFYTVILVAIAYTSEFITYSVIIGFFLLLTLTDIVLNTVFLVGGHQKNPMLLRAYYIYSLVLCVLTALVGSAFSIYTLQLYKLAGEKQLNIQIRIVMSEIFFLMAEVSVQVYVLLLLRSEILKLTSSHGFRFVNNAAEAECTMKFNEDTMDAKEIVIR